jgi:signal transduction histidine kinase
VGALAGTIARRSLAPLARLALRSQRITAEQLHERLPVEGASLELDQLAAAFNVTFARLEESFDRLKRFTADVSHELRTPLTALRTVGEVALRGNHDAAGYREVIGSMLVGRGSTFRIVVPAASPTSLDAAPRGRAMDAIHAGG